MLDDVATGPGEIFTAGGGKIERPFQLRTGITHGIEKKSCIIAGAGFYFVIINHDRKRDEALNSLGTI
jgi:hypothetical protein